MTCPACRAESQAQPVERRRDPVEGKDYDLFACRNCGVGFSEPRAPVGPDWYDKTPIGKEETLADDWRYETFLKDGIPPGRLLDAGCGAGLLLLAARERGFTVSGFDFNPEYIRALKSQGVTDVWAMDYQSFFRRNAAVFDAVALFDVLEHVPEPAELLEAIAKASRPGGSLAVTVPNGNRPLPGPSFREDWDYPPFHFTRWTKASLSRALEKAGFTVARSESSPLPFGFFSGLLYYRFLKLVFPWLKRLVSGPGSSEKTWTELLASDAAGTSKKSPGLLTGSLGAPAARQRIIDAGYRLLFWLLSPLEAPYILWLRKYRPEQGKTLYILARRA